MEKDTENDRNYGLDDFMTDFPDETAALGYVLHLKRGSRPKEKFYRQKNSFGFITNDGKYYNPLKGTIFHGVRLPLDRWFLAVFFLHYSPYWSIKEFSSRLNVPLLTGFNIIHKVRPLINRKKSFIKNLNDIIGK